MDAPLAGKRVVVTRAANQATALVTLLEASGAEVLVFPTIEIVDPEDFREVEGAIRDLDLYAWAVFTSTNAVDRFFARMAAADKDARHMSGLRVAAVGPATAAALGGHGIRPDFVPDEHVGEGVLEGLCVRGVGEGSRVLLPRAAEARELLPEELRARGVHVDVVPVYRTLPGAGDPAVLERLRAGEVDAVTFTSSSTVRNFKTLTEGVDLSGMAIACIGPVTAATARELGMDVAVEPEEYTVPALVEALGAYFA
jgi:uroporphyrinogen III methyltransferase/synthase